MVGHNTKKGTSIKKKVHGYTKTQHSTRLTYLPRFDPSINLLIFRGQSFTLVFPFFPLSFSLFFSYFLLLSLFISENKTHNHFHLNIRATFCLFILFFNNKPTYIYTNSFKTKSLLSRNVSSLKEKCSFLF